MKIWFVFLTLSLCLISCDQKLGSGKPLDMSTIEVEEGSFFIDIKSPSKGKSHLPRLKASGDKLYMTWVEQEDSLAILKYSYYEGETWSAPETITSGRDWFVNWADFPALGINGDYILTNILQKSAEGTYDYDIKLHLYKKDKVVKSNFLLHTDGIPAEHGFVSMQAYDGGFYASWLDGRNTKNKDKSKNQMSLRSAYIDLEGTITEDTEIDMRVCDCCNTATAITNNGPIVVYRDRSRTMPEIRDMAIVRWVDGKWIQPKVIGSDHWELNGCPVNGPAVDTKEEQVVVTWFTAQGDDPRVLTAFSTNNGEDFGTPIRIDSGNAIGRVDINFLEDGSALVSWLEPQEETAVLQVARVYSDGRLEEAITITAISTERQSGFPQLEILKGQAFVAYTEQDGDSYQIKLVKFNIH